MSARERHQIQQHLAKIGVELDSNRLNDFMYRKTSQDYNPEWILQKAGT
jgi:hypothetical protein